MNDNSIVEFGESQITKRQVFFVNLEDDSEGTEEESDGKGRIELMEKDGRVILNPKGIVGEIIIGHLLEAQLGIDSGDAEYNRQVKGQKPEGNLEIVFEKKELKPFKVVIRPSDIEFCDLKNNPLNFDSVMAMVESIGAEKVE